MREWNIEDIYIHLFYVRFVTSGAEFPESFQFSPARLQIDAILIFPYLGFSNILS